MFSPPSNLSDLSGSLEPAAFQTQLRRLESLQTLMIQGGSVVSEVTQFLTKVREELSVFQREHATFAGMQQRVFEEKEELLSKLAALEKATEESAYRSNKYEAKIAQLQSALENQDQRMSKEEFELEQKKRTEQQNASSERIASLENALRNERELRDSALGQVREDEASQHSMEVALLKNRVSALEIQLEAEKERRLRLMDVVKTHDVTLNARALRESV